MYNKNQSDRNVIFVLINRDEIIRDFKGSEEQLKIIQSPKIFAYHGLPSELDRQNQRDLAHK